MMQARRSTHQVDGPEEEREGIEKDDVAIIPLAIPAPLRTGRESRR